MSKLTGGSAFPESYSGAFQPHEGIGFGMTLRDYFAAQALPAIIQESKMGITSDAASAYRYADAMLAERGKNDTTDNM